MWARRLIALAVGAAALLSASSASASALERMAARGELRVCTSSDVKPVAFLSPSGEMEGFLPSLVADLNDKMSAKLGKPLKLEIVRITPLNRIEFLNQGRCDLLLAAFLDTPARRKVIDFVEPGFYSSRAALLAPHGHGLKTWSDLRGRTVCAPATSAWVRPYEERYGIRFASYPTTQESKLAALKGLCSGLLMDDVIADSMVSSGTAPGFESALPPQDAFAWGIGVRKGDPELKAALSQIVTGWHASGLVLDLERRWGLKANPYAHGLGQPAQAASAPGHGLRSWLTARGVNLSFVWDPADRARLATGLGQTLMLAAVAIPGALAIGVLAVWLARLNPIAERLVGGYVAVVRATPVLAQLYILYFGVGSLLGIGNGGGGSGPFLYAAAALALHYGALCADALRGAIDTVSGPLREAAASLGLTTRQQFTRVVLPLGVRVAFPAIGNIAIQVLKTTTVAYAIAVPELLYAANRIWADNANAPETMAALFLLFLGLAGGLTMLLRSIERRIAVPGLANVH